MPVPTMVLTRAFVSARVTGAGGSGVGASLMSVAEHRSEDLVAPGEAVADVDQRTAIPILAA